MKILTKLFNEDIENQSQEDLILIYNLALKHAEEIEKDFPTKNTSQIQTLIKYMIEKDLSEKLFAIEFPDKRVEVLFQLKSKRKIIGYQLFPEKETIHGYYYEERFSPSGIPVGSSSVYFKDFFKEYSSEIKNLEQMIEKELFKNKISQI